MKLEEYLDKQFYVSGLSLIVCVILWLLVEINVNDYFQRILFFPFLTIYSFYLLKTFKIFQELKLMKKEETKIINLHDR